MVKYCKVIVVMVVVVSLLCCSNRQSYVSSSTDTAVTRPDAININTASIDELEKLSHIGRKTAENIVRFREENGPFRRVEHVVRIRGISESRYTELRPYIKAE